MDTNSKPKLPTGVTYRDPATGRFIKREEGESRVRTGGSVKVGTGGAVSNEDIAKFIQTLAQQKFQEGMASSFNQHVPESDMKREEFAKLFDTISNQVISKLSSVNSSLLELKKTNSDQGTRLINLSTSIFSSISSQKDTIDELYKIIDTRLAELVGKESKSEPKDTGSDKQSFKTAGLIRGIGGLNKQLVELNKSVTSKIIPILSTISEKISGIKIEQTVAAATPSPTAAKPVEETEKVPSAGTKIVKKDEKSSYTMSKLEMLGDGLTKLLGGGALLGLGASINGLSESILNLPETISKIVNEKKEETKSSAKGLLENVLSGVGLGDDNFFNQNPDWLEKYGNFLSKSGTDFESMASTASDAIFKSDISPFSAKGWEKDLTELDNVFGQVSSTFKLFVDDIAHIKKYAEESGLLDWVHGLFGNEPKIDPMQDKNLDLQKPVSKKSENIKTDKTNSQIKPKEVIKRAKPKLRNQPIGEFSIVNTASTPNIDNNILKQPISPITQSIKESTRALEDSKTNTVQGNGQQSSPVVVNNNTSNNQNMGLLHSPSPRNNETTKQTLDRMMLYGNYTGTGFLLN